ncbi:MAG: hypothetical protein IT326_05390 [Anaerolineae bacterium]|nr:hypothetical protein [Anaerolineae bacterium]
MMSSNPNSSLDDDLFGAFASGSKDVPDDFLKDLILDDVPPPEDDPFAVMTPAPEPAPAPAPAGKKPARAPKAAAQQAPRVSSRGFLGMTPQQRMILSVFFFLDVAVLGFLILYALGAISL